MANQAVSDLEYDLLSVLHNKSEAIKAYDTYIQDAQAKDSKPCVELFKKLQEQDISTANEVREHLKQVMEKGKM
ncbi:MAG: hypothetical protein SAL07_13010 [Oscillatoria sp. PMC 1051.18]|nr:hypothetical protein [Oscillatoria sp. PMC 1050.18]MEC5030811.1 hypothetical protein [Oscillatoria sp. PMC 1051.18]